MKQTVYPTRGAGFPPASFWRLGDAMAYSLQMAREQQNSGVAMCPPEVFSSADRPDTVPQVVQFRLPGAVHRVDVSVEVLP